LQVGDHISAGGREGGDGIRSETIETVDSNLKMEAAFPSDTSVSAYNPDHKQVGQTNKNSAALVHKRTIPTERPPFVGEVSANFSG
jgi:hypothetical protein